jgi:hypothetical protein
MGIASLPRRSAALIARPKDAKPTVLEVGEEVIRELNGIAPAAGSSLAKKSAERFIYLIKIAFRIRQSPAEALWAFNFQNRAGISQ